MITSSFSSIATSGSSTSCIPIDIQPLDQNGFLIAASSTDNLLIEAFNANNTSDLSFASDSLCETPLLIDNPTGKWVKNFTQGEKSLRLYLETGVSGGSGPGHRAPTTVYGEHYINIILNSGLKRTVYFTVRDPNK